MSGVWLMTRAMPRGKNSIVPGPPMSLQLSGLMVLVIILMSTSSSVCPGARPLSGAAAGIDAGVLPAGAPTGVPVRMLFGFRYGVAPVVCIAAGWLTILSRIFV